MLIPTGMGKHKELSTSYTKFDQLLQELAKNRFNGYIKLIFWGFEGVLVFDTGRIIQGYASEQQQYLTGEASVLRILAKAGENDGGIEIYQLRNETAASLGFAIKAAPPQNSGEKEDISFKDIISAFEKDSATGYIDLQFRGKKGMGTIYFLEGIPVETIVMSNTGKMVSGEKVLSKISEISDLLQSVEIYRVNDPMPLIPGSAFLVPWSHQGYLVFWREFFNYFRISVNEKLRKYDLSRMIKRECLTLANEFPFLHPQTGALNISDEKFELGTILCHGEFLRALIKLLKNVLVQIPPRKLKRINFIKIISDSRDIARNYHISTDQLDPERFIYKVLDGII